MFVSELFDAFCRLGWFESSERMIGEFVFRISFISACASIIDFVCLFVILYVLVSIGFSIFKFVRRKLASRKRS